MIYPSENKYHNKKVAIDGMTFDSRKEYNRWVELLWLQQEGLVRDLKRQVKYVLIPVQKISGKVVERECAYIADFVYFDVKKNTEVVEDTKSPATRTKEYIIKRKLMLYVHGIMIQEL